MDVALLCPLVAGIVKWNAPEPLLTVIVKGTFALTGVGAGKLMREQEPLYVEWPWGADPDQEVDKPNDFVPRKPRADVFVVGHAHGEEALTSLPISIEVKGVPQRLRKRALAVAGAPSRKTPLTAVFLRDDDGIPVRLGPVAGPRDWREHIDARFEMASFNTAPADQQMQAVASGCRLVLEGLVEGAPSCEVRVAPVEPAAYLVSSRAPNAVGQAIPLRCDTLYIDADRALCTLTWRGETAAPSSAEAFLAVDARANKGPSWPEVAAELALATWTPAAEERSTLAGLGITVEEPVTKQRPRRRTKADTLAMGPSLGPAPSEVRAPRGRMDTIAEPLDLPPEGALPFRQPAAGGLPERTVPIATTQVSEGPSSSQGSATLDPDAGAALRARLASSSAMPFKPATQAAAPAAEGPVRLAKPVPPPRQRSETRALSEEQVQDLQAQMAAAGALPWQDRQPAPPPPPSHPGSPPGAEPPPSRPVPPARPSQPMGWPFAQPPAPGVPPPRPPSPLLTPDVVSPPPKRDKPDAPVVPALDTLSLKRYAAIKAALLDGTLPLSKILAKEKVTEREWRLNDRQMAIELARDATTGTGSLAAKLRQEIDNARRVQPEDQPATDPAEDLNEYCTARAEIEEAEDPAAAISQLGLTPKEWARIRRKWTGRCLSDNALAEMVREGLAEARRSLRRQSELDAVGQKPSPRG